ncbi:MAG: glycosyltransferase family 2 protein [bacterium]|nr:glycosyltransferase family 2 protein [bacterium]
MATLSVIIPVYNEAKTIRSIVDLVRSVDLGDVQKEIIAVDDCSTDGTREALHALAADGVRVLLHERNRGKGAALRTGFAAATGDYLVVQDADLEYDPHDYPLLLAPLLAGTADVVYGSRYLGNRPRPVTRFWHSLANRIITLCANMTTNLALTDVATCYKAFTKEAMARILPRLTAERFDIEVDITARVAKERLRLYEVGVVYVGRSYADGKKIGVRDGIAFLWAMVKYNWLRS